MKIRVVSIAVSLSLGLTACGAAQEPGAHAVTPAVTTTNAGTDAAPKASPDAAPVNGPVSAGKPGALPPSCASLPPDEKHTFTRVPMPVQRVTSIGVGEANRAAVYAPGQAKLFDGKSFRELTLPELPADADVRIFFGRDNQPRLMGFGTGADGSVRSVYWRYRHGRFQPEPSELGPLGSPTGALYGVLGFEDPEVVCRPGVTCLVKRISGWGRAPAHERPIPIVLSNGQVFALHEDRVDQLKKDAWAPLTPARAFQRPVDAWQEPNGALFIAEGGSLVRLAGGVWTELPAPVAALRAVWGQSANDLFVAGATGAAHYDGTSFRCIREVPGPLTAIARVGAELWIAGETGIHSTRLGR